MNLFGELTDEVIVIYFYVIIRTKRIEELFLILGCKFD